MKLQLHHVVSDVTGVTGMKFIRAIVVGRETPMCSRRCATFAARPASRPSARRWSDTHHRPVDATGLKLASAPSGYAPQGVQRHRPIPRVAYLGPAVASNLAANRRGRSPQRRGNREHACAQQPHAGQRHALFGFELFVLPCLFYCGTSLGDEVLQFKLSRPSVKGSREAESITLLQPSLI